MDATLFVALAMACAPGIHIDTVRALVQVESSFNPWAIGVVGGVLERQPKSAAEALATARVLVDEGHDFSVGLGQINVRNFGRLGLTMRTAFDPCTNLTALQSVLVECFERAGRSDRPDAQAMLRRTLSCYYSGNETTGFRHGYVRKVVEAARLGSSRRLSHRQEQP